MWLAWRCARVAGMRQECGSCAQLKRCRLPGQEVAHKQARAHTHTHTYNTWLLAAVACQQAPQPHLLQHSRHFTV